MLIGPKTTFGELGSVILPGEGICLDVGCGDGRQRLEIEQSGYKWLGMDLRPYRELTFQGDALQLPLQSGICNAVVSWQSLEHFPRPWIVMQEIHRILKPGGLFCGSTSFLEPFHDFSYFGFSELGLRQLLEDSGFTSTRIIPGISAFPLIGWTLFSRMAGGRLARPVFALTNMMLRLANYLYPLTHRLFFKIYSRSAPRLANSYWFGQAPTEFAGHLAFRAFKVG